MKNDPQHHPKQDPQLDVSADDTRMQRFWAWLGLNLGRRAGIVSLVGLIITVGLGAGIPRLKFATGQDSYLDKDSPVAVDNVEYQNLFGGQAMLTLVTLDPGTKAVDLVTGQNATTWQQLTTKLQGSDHTFSVLTPMTGVELVDRLVKSPDGNPATSLAGKMLLDAQTRDPSPEGQAIRQKNTIDTLTRMNAIPAAERVLSNPAWVDFLLHENDGSIRAGLKTFFPDDTHAQMVVRLPGNASIEADGAAATFVSESVAGVKFQGATTVTTGASVLLKDINDYLTKGMLMLGLAAVGIMVLILLIAFDVRWRLLPLAVVVMGIVWAFGLAGFLGLPLTVVTIAGLPVMLGVGIDYAIQMHSRIEEEVLIDHASHPIQKTARNLGPALLVVTFDAIFAFAALRFAKVPMIRDFGLLLAIGIAAICLCSIVGPLAILGIREHKSPTKGKDFSEGRLGRIVVWLGSMPATYGAALAVAAIVIFAGGAAVESKLELQTDPIKWVDQSSQTIKDLDTVKAATGSASELGVFIRSNDLFSDATVAYVDRIGRENVEQHPEALISQSSLVATLAGVTEVKGASHIVPTGAQLKELYDLAPADIQKALVNPQARSMNLIYRVGNVPLARTATLIDEMRTADGVPSGVQATPSGLAVVGAGLLENLEANRVGLTYLAIGFVFLFLAIRMRSVVRSLLSLVPVLIAVGTSSLVAFAFHLKLSPMTAVGGPLVIAACTEFTSLILFRYLEERANGLDPKEAVDLAAARTGRAFMVSGMTAIAGVAVIACSSLPLLRDFGTIVAMNVAVALFSALIVLPPMLVWADKREWVSKGRPPVRHDTGTPIDLTAPVAAGEGELVGAGHGTGGGRELFVFETSALNPQVKSFRWRNGMTPF